MSKRIISLLLSLALVLGTVGGTAGAADVQEVIVTFDCNYANHGGFFKTGVISGLTGSNSDKRTLTTTADGNYGKLPVESDFEEIPEGYTLDGWYTAATGGQKLRDNLSLTSTSNHTIYAQWVKKSRTVTLDLDGGKYNNSIANITERVTHGSTYSSVLSKYRPSRGNDKFAGWVASGSTGIFDLNQSVTTADVGSALTLTAKWVKQLTVTFDANGGSVSPASKTYDENTEYGTLPTPTRALYKFEGWYDAETGGTKVTEKSQVTKDTTLYAYWTAADRKVIFDPGEGTLANDSNKKASMQKDESGDTVTYKYPATLPKPTLFYHTFKGWFTSATGGNEIKGGDTVTATTTDVTLYAQWTLNQKIFTVYSEPNDNDTYDSNSKNTEMTRDCGTKYEDIPGPTRAGYKFSGWYSDANCQTSINGIIKLDGSPDALYAGWTPATYEVTLDPNGGDLEDSKKTTTATYNSTYLDIKSLNVPTRTGYTFKGWFTAKEDGTEVTSSTTVTETKNHTLYAQWNPQPAHISIDYQIPSGIDGTYTEKPLTKNTLNLEKQFKDIGLPENPASFKYNGKEFLFASWYTTATDNPNSGKPVVGETKLTADLLNGGSLNVKLFARWRFSVGFYNNYTTPSANANPDQTSNYITGNAYGNFPSEPTRTGYTFMGWYTAPDDTGTPVSKTSIASADVQKLYAHWTTSTYKVTLDPTKGKFSDNQLSATIKGFNHGDSYGFFLKDYIPSPPAGHTFDGWYTEKEGGTKLTPDTKVTETCTIYAHWKANQYKLTLKLGYSGASDIVKSVDYETELSKALPSPEPERTGFAFDGWFEDEKFTKAIDTKHKIKENITLYAKWTEAEKVDLNLGGGKLDSGVPSYIYVYEGGTYEKLPEPTWPGNMFVGWYTTETGSTKVERSTKVTKPIPQTLYARWAPLEVTVTLNYNGAPIETRQQKYKVGDKYSRLPTYARWNAYEFMGWYTQAVGGEKVDRSTEVSVASNDKLEVTLYTHWGYKVAFEPGDGIGDMESQVAEMNQPYTLPECAFTPPEGMRFGGWAIGTPDGPKQASGSQYTVVRNLTLYATWTDKPITVKATCTSGGSLMTTDGKSNTVTAERGTDVTFVARANTGYELRDLQVDGVSFNFTEEYTFRNISEDHEIHAVFALIGAPAYSSCDHGSSCPLSGYRDLNPNAWYHDAVHFCMDNVIMGGSGNTFSPNTRASRADVATSLWSAEDRPSPLGSGPLPNTYSDVKVSDWYYQPIEWATKQGILAGYGNGKFGPNDNITREQLVSILWRHAGQPKPRQTVLRFKDASRVSDFAWEAMCWATEQRIVQGRPDGSLAPKGTATRADVAQMLKNYLG